MFLDKLNQRLAVKKAASVTDLERMGQVIARTSVGGSDAVFQTLAKKECCPTCGSDLSMYNPNVIQKGEGCPKCGAKMKDSPLVKGGVAIPGAKEEDAKKKPSKAVPAGEDDSDDSKANPFAKAPAKEAPAKAAPAKAAPAKDADPISAQAGLDSPKPPAPTGQRGGFLYEGDTPPPQSPSASDMVQNIGSALGHRVEVNSDAPGMGVSHAAMLVHPEWNHDNIKSKIKGHLEGKGWKTEGSGKDKKSVTHTSPDGHKVHVQHVGHHMVISSEDAEGTIPKALRQAAPEMDAKGKPVKKDEPIQKEELVQKEDSFSESVQKSFTEALSNFKVL